MSCLYYRSHDLYIENVRLADAANQFDTPCYVYSRATLVANWRAFHEAFQSLPHRICYAVKANSNLTILRLLAELNTGFDIVSLGELERVIAAGGDTSKVIFSGVGKKQHEIERAIQLGIYCFNVESIPEIERLQATAEKLKQKINIALRVNPNVNPNTHSHISTGLKENKFGIESSEILPLCRQLSTMPALRLIGIGCHIGSQIVDLQPFSLAIDHLLELYQQLKTMGHTLSHLNIGGGLGITYRDEEPPQIQDYAALLQHKLAGLPLEIIMEPGRSIVGTAGVLLTRVEYVKYTTHKNFAIVDAGMNDLLRPALYDAWQNILPATRRHGDKKRYDIAGPVCESADFLGKDREMNLQQNDLLAVDCAGAYGFSMSSNYNSRCRPAEVLIDDQQMQLIRRRETIADLWASEKE